MKFVIIIISMVLVNNYPLAQFLGICPFLGVSKDLNSSTGMGIAVTFVMVLATAVTWPIQQLLNKFGIGYLQTVVFILVIAALVQLVEMFMKKSMPALYKSLGIFLPLITTNCAVLGVSIETNFRDGEMPGDYAVFSGGIKLGSTLDEFTAALGSFETNSTDMSTSFSYNSQDYSTKLRYYLYSSGDYKSNEATLYNENWNY